jgi:hypothetical protein
MVVVRRTREVLEKLHRANIGFHGIPAEDIERAKATGIAGGYHKIHEWDVADSKQFMQRELPQILLSIAVFGGGTPGLLLIDLNKAPRRTEHPQRFTGSRILNGSGNIYSAPKEAVIGGVALTPQEYQALKQKKLGEREEYLEIGRWLMRKSLRFMKRKKII